MHFSLVYKELKCVDLKEKNRKQMYDQIKKGSMVGEKIHCSFKILSKENLKLNKLLKKYF